MNWFKRLFGFQDEQVAMPQQPKKEKPYRRQEARLRSETAARPVDSGDSGWLPYWLMMQNTTGPSAAHSEPLPHIPAADPTTAPLHHNSGDYSTPAPDTTHHSHDAGSFSAPDSSSFGGDHGGGFDSGGSFDSGGGGFDSGDSW